MTVLEAGRRGPGLCDLCGHYVSQHHLRLFENALTPCQLIECECPNFTYEYEYTNEELMNPEASEA